MADSERNLRVLLVDDDVVDQIALVRALEQLAVAAEISVSDDADAALAQLRAEPFHVLFSDLHMPGHDGLWLLEKIRAEAIDVPVVVLTGHGDEQTAVTLMKAGAADYIPKSLLSVNRLRHVLQNTVRVHRAEQQARRAQERLRLALGAAGMGTWDLNLHTGELSCDERCKELLGVPSTDSVTVAEAREAIHPDDRGRAAEAQASAMDPQGGGLFESELRIIGRRDGVERWLRARGQVFFQERRPERFVGTLMDMTARKREEEAARARLEFEQQLIGIVSHDLRNPISAMVMGASLLKQKLPADSPLLATVRRILSSGDRASRLIRDLLDFTQARTGHGLPVQRRSCDLHVVCKQTVEELSVNHPDRLIVHTMEGSGEGHWDPDRVGQVLGNLLRNAVIYSPTGTVVTVLSQGLAHHVRLQVHNQGQPIPAEVLPTLFQPFQRPDRKQDPDRSIGLGLFIVREIVAAHGGTVSVRSTASDGTTFTVDLPRAGAAERLAV